MKEELEMIKAFAKLDGIKLDEMVVDFAAILTHHFKGEPQFSEYNPITDLALNCAARDKYEVEIDYTYDSACLCGKSFSYFKGKKDIPRAIIECILKSKGMWND